MAIEDLEEIEAAYERLFRNFRDDQGDFKYTDLITRMIMEGKRSLIVDFEDLILMDDIFESDLADTLLVYPERMINVGSSILASFVKEENPDYFYKFKDDKFFVRFNSLPTPIHIRDVRSSHVDSLYWVEGIIIRTTEIKSIVDKAVFICAENDEHIIKMKFKDGIYTKPDHCSVETCKSKTFRLDQKTSKMIDWQFITLQEKPEDLPPGASPKSVPCQLIDDLVNAVRPGDRVVVGGVIRSRPTKTIKSGQLLTFDTWVEVNYIESSTKDDDFTDITPEEEREFLEMARDPKIHDRLLESIAPAIYGLKEVKQAALLMLFGGVDKHFADGFTTRGQPNILLVGDPGVAKSQLLRYIHSIAPRGLYTSGKGSSAAGLTAAIIRDPETGEITLEAGAMVLADRGLCLIDEFDKMNENDRSAIHEAMEQHTVSVAKAGIVATLNSRTGVLAAANPKYGRYEDHRTFNENVNLSPAILSRFDLVFVLKDKPAEDKDAILAEHILKLHRFHGSSDSVKPPMNEDKLKKYISYAKKNYHPTLTQEASELMETFYVNMRNAYASGNTENPQERITITARQLEGIIRLAEARSKAALRTEVSKNDAQFAIDLMKYSLTQIATDPESGAMDIDAFYSGQTGSKRSKLNKLLSVIDFVYRDVGGKFTEASLIDAARSEGLSEEYVRGAIRQMIRDGSLYQPKLGFLDKP